MQKVQKMVHPVEAYVAGKRLNTMLTVYLRQGIRNLSLAPSNKSFRNQWARRSLPAEI